MEIRNLKTFVVVAELNSFTKAAKVLGYSQSTVSFQIKQLEDEIGVPLFERIYHTLTLTEHGRDLMKLTYRIDKELGAYMENIKHSQEVVGEVKIALANSLCVALIDKVVPELRQKYPNVKLFCDTAGTEDLLSSLNQNENDLIYVMDSPVYNADYKILKKEKVNTYFICSPTNPLANEKYVSVEKLIEEPFLLTEKGMSYRRIFDEELAKRDLKVNPVFESGDTYLLCDLVSKGCGISLLPDYACKSMIDEGAVCEIKVDDELKPIVFAQLLIHQEKWISNSLQAVIDCISGCNLTKSV